MSCQHGAAPALRAALQGTLAAHLPLHALNLTLVSFIGTLCLRDLHGHGSRGLQVSPEVCKRCLGQAALLSPHTNAHAAALSVLRSAMLHGTQYLRKALGHTHKSRAPLC